MALHTGSHRPTSWILMIGQGKNQITSKKMHTSHLRNHLKSLFKKVIQLMSKKFWNCFSHAMKNRWKGYNFSHSRSNPKIMTTSLANVVQEWSLSFTAEVDLNWSHLMSCFRAPYPLSLMTIRLPVTSLPCYQKLMLRKKFLLRQSWASSLGIGLFRLRSSVASYQGPRSHRLACILSITL